MGITGISAKGQVGAQMINTSNIGSKINPGTSSHLDTCFNNTHEAHGEPADRHLGTLPLRVKSAKLTSGSKWHFPHKLIDVSFGRT